MDGGVEAPDGPPSDAPDVDGVDGGVDAPDGPPSDAADAASVDGGIDAPDGPPSDAADAANVDSGVDAPDGPPSGSPDAGGVCDQTKPFGAVTLANGTDSMEGDATPWLSRNELTMYFASTRGGTQAIYMATRTSREMPFGAASLVPGLAANVAGSNDGRPVLPADELTIYFESSRTGISSIFYSTRTTPQDGWSMPQLLVDVNDGLTDDDGGPFIMPAGNVLYFHAIQAGRHEIFRTERNDGGWSPPTALRNIDLPSQEDLLPVLSDDELTIFFTSTRSDVNGDIFVATRPSQMDDFAVPLVVRELNTTYFDGPGWLSPDGCRLYFMSGDGGGTRIFVASRPPLTSADGGSF
jgi:Tol biopolymer transport system component